MSHIDLDRVTQPAATGDQPVPDSFNYDLVVMEGGRTREVAFDDRAVTPELRELIAFVMKHPDK